jgi:hypothetical protein
MAPLVAPTTDRRQLLSEIDGLRANRSPVRRQIFSGTALWDSVLASIALFRPVRPGDAIYVITDGADNLSHADSGSVSQTLAAAGIRLFCFGIINADWLGLRPSARTTGATELLRVMEATGGWGTAAAPSEWDAFEKSRQPEELARSLAELYRQLTSFYRVDLELPEPLAGPQEWTLSPTGLDDSAKPAEASETYAAAKNDLVLIYPNRLMPCN